jgi:signal transduction histidine kinase
VTIVNEQIQNFARKTYTLATLLELQNYELDNFRQIAEVIADDSPVILNINVAPDGIISDVYPIENNELLIGFDFFDDAEGNIEALRAVEEGRLVLTGPFANVRGIQVLSARLPVFTAQPDGTQQFWGLISVTLDFSTLIELLDFDRIIANDVVYEIWRINPENGEHQTIAGSAAASPDYIEKSIRIQNAHWYFRVYLVQTWYMYPETWFILLSGLLISFLTAFVAQSNKELRIVRYDLQNLTGTLNKMAVRFLSGDHKSFKDLMTSEGLYIADAVQIDRISVWRNIEKPDGLYSSQIYRWERSSGGTTESHPDFLNIRFEKYAPNWKKTLEANEAVNSNMQFMPEHEAAAFKPYGIASLYVTPVFIQDCFWGFALFEDHRTERLFSSSHARFMSSAAFLFATAIIRNETEALISEKNSEIQASLEQAIEATHAKSEFLSRMSHEMLTPMNAIMGMTRIAIKSEISKKAEDCLTEIDTAAHNLLNMINDALDLSGGNEALVLYGVKFSFSAMIEGVVEKIEPHVIKKQQKFTLDIAPEIPDSLSGDVKRLTQLIMNLLTNAVSFSPTRGEIHLSAKVLNEQDDFVILQLEVEDNGIGISKENQEKLFVIFEQVDGSFTRKHGGMGLGLALSKYIVEAMDGRIWVESELDKGSKFTFTCKLKKAKLTYEQDDKL